MNNQHILFVTILALGVVTGCSTAPKLSESAESSMRDTAEEMRMLALGCHLYAKDHDGTLPNSLGEVLQYVPEGDLKPQQYELAASGKIDGFSDPATAILFKKSTLEEAGQQGVAFVDGHVVFMGTD